MQAEIIKPLTMFYLPVLLATLVLCFSDIVDGQINMSKIYNLFGTVWLGSFFTFMFNSEFVRNNVFEKNNKVETFLLINIVICIIAITLKKLFKRFEAIKTQRNL